MTLTGRWLTPTQWAQITRGKLLPVLTSHWATVWTTKVPAMPTTLKRAAVTLLLVTDTADATARDEGKILRAVATYRDEMGTGNNTATGVSERAVRA